MPVGTEYLGIVRVSRPNSCSKYLVSAYSEIRSYMYGVPRRHSYRLQSNIGGAHHHMAFAVPKRKKNVTLYFVEQKDSSFPPKHNSTSRFGTWGKSSGLFQRNAMLANWRRCRYKTNEGMRRSRHESGITRVQMDRLAG